MTIEWTKADEQHEYYYGQTQTRFSAQIGDSTNSGMFVWTIFHDDFRYCVHGDESTSLKDAQQQAAQWLDANAQSV